MSDKDEAVRFTVQMPPTLREDAKESTERGELAEEIRDLFREKAYGVGGTESSTQLERKQAELERVQRNKEDARHDRNKLNSKIQTLEQREERLKAEIDELQQDKEQIDQWLATLERMVQNGTRMWPRRIKNELGVDSDTARELYDRLKAQNANLPDEAFSEPSIHTPSDWTEVQSTQ